MGKVDCLGCLSDEIEQHFKTKKKEVLMIKLASTGGGILGMW